jgi:hypothetical protein
LFVDWDLEELLFLASGLPMKRNLFLPLALLIYPLILIIAFPFSATASQAEIQSQFANQIQEFYGKSGHYSGIWAILFLSLGPSELISVPKAVPWCLRGPA